ncbi:MAG: dephospho-CoA kinase [Clostridia bacterium]|nr:dephospho-CoA kinase [Clostridia bacterium]
MEKIILITGKSGSGKSYFAKLLSQKLNCPVLDIDKIGHKIYENKQVYKKVVSTFKNVETNNIIDTKKLGEIVFSDSKKMQLLEEITWEEMLKIINTEIKKHPTIILDWALLPKTELWQNGIKVLVTAEQILRKQAILKRDNISESYFDLREQNSLDYTKFNYDFVIENDYCNLEEKTNLITNYLKEN